MWNRNGRKKMLECQKKIETCFDKVWFYRFGFLYWKDFLMFPNFFILNSPLVVVIHSHKFSFRSHATSEKLASNTLTNLDQCFRRKISFRFPFDSNLHYWLFTNIYKFFVCLLKLPLRLEIFSLVRKISVHLKVDY